MRFAPKPGTQSALIIFDSNLLPCSNETSRKPGMPVIDRTQLILDIFARHARSREGQLQVELAQLNYMLPRLTGKGTSMSRLGGRVRRWRRWSGRRKRTHRVRGP